MLHSSIFSCCELTQLELADCYIPGLPTCFAGFPNLTSLRLSDVGFPDGAKGLEILLARSPLLKSLSLLMLLFPAKNGVYHQWVIQAPNLQNFFITGLYDDGWQIGDLTFLEEATVDWPLYSFDRDFVKLITGLSQARELDFAMPVRDVNVLEGLSCSFKNLKCLSLCTSLHLLSNVLSFFCIIRNASKLETLRIKLFDDSTQDDEVDNDFLNGQWTDDLFSNLKSVYVRNMTCKLSEMHFIEFILSKARNLEKNDVCLAEDCSKSNEEAVIELAK
ncbi:uncharacterized protein LOC127781958 [Oryza glaberrima]|nr:uncharacterized protein LOC127781958 [Oryza glaberrima]